MLLLLCGCEFGQTVSDNESSATTDVSAETPSMNVPATLNASEIADKGLEQQQSNPVATEILAAQEPEISEIPKATEPSSLLEAELAAGLVELDQSPEVEVEITTPPPISGIKEDLEDSRAHSSDLSPGILLPSPTLPPSRKNSRTIHYDEIDQSRLRRTELAYLFGEEKPYTGLAFKTHPDGTRSFEIDYVDGSAEGVLTQYYPNGNPSFQVPMKNNQANGVSTGWYEDQTRKSEYPYKDGVVHGVIKEWFPTGQIGFQANYVDGKITGTLIGWHLNGDEYTIGTVAESGSQRFTAYFGPGRKWKETGWRNGKLWGYSYEWTADGKLRTLKRFVDGKLMRVIK